MSETEQIETSSERPHRANGCTDITAIPEELTIASDARLTYEAALPRSASSEPTCCDVHSGTVQFATTAMACHFSRKRWARPMPHATPSQQTKHIKAARVTCPEQDEPTLPATRMKAVELSVRSAALRGCVQPRAVNNSGIEQRARWYLIGRSRGPAAD
jgi:hypothetical protein